MLRVIFDLVKESLEGLNPTEVPVQAAAIAFYALLSLTPLVTISVAIAGLLFNKAVVEGQMMTMVRDIIGKTATTPEI